ncbi:hypothetical protein [Citrobacter freundii]|uniref:hypothetical protein n=1 Tax=Citrobacter freundii TaxID=546 RepID=UPI002B26D405|nr:hypothetical protein [Citrobacter freundii]MEA8858828.1 hypothetical protein [Citrobacter freundii]
MGKIHLTVGVYNNDDHVRNGVDEEHLQSHIKYNKDFRPGRALFVDGKCVHHGYLEKERCDAWEKKISDEFTVPDRCTAPYR